MTKTSISCSTLALLLGSFASGNLAHAQGSANCLYTLDTSEVGIADVKIVENYNTQGTSHLQVSFSGAEPNALYTIWIDFKNRALDALPADYPLDKGALPRGVAPAFSSTEKVTNGMGLDRNGIITDSNGNATFNVTLDYQILNVGNAPVVGGELTTQGLNLIGGYWLRQYTLPVDEQASTQLIDPDTGLPLLERATPQGLTIVRHAEWLTHGHTPGVSGVDQFSAFKGDFPAECIDQIRG